MCIILSVFICVLILATGFAIRSITSHRRNHCAAIAGGFWSPRTENCCNRSDTRIGTQARVSSMQFALSVLIFSFHLNIKQAPRTSTRQLFDVYVDAPMPPGHTDAIGRMKYLFQWTMELLSASDVKRFNEHALELLLQGTK